MRPWEFDRPVRAANRAEPLHVFPLGDLREHVLSGCTCWCLPRVEEDGAVIVHNSADGREAYERGERKPS